MTLPFLDKFKKEVAKLETVGVGLKTVVHWLSTGNYALNLGGPSAYFSTFGIGMIVVFISLAAITRHIGRTVAEMAGVKVGATAGH